MSHDTDKLIRQLSLVAFLMAERRPLTARDVKGNVEGYSEMSDEAFARRFYSDRAELTGSACRSTRSVTSSPARSCTRCALGALLPPALELDRRRAAAPDRASTCSRASSPTPSRCGSRFRTSRSAARLRAAADRDRRPRRGPRPGLLARDARPAGEARERDLEAAHGQVRLRRSPATRSASDDRSVRALLRRRPLVRDRPGPRARGVRTFRVSRSGATSGSRRDASATSASRGLRRRRRTAGERTGRSATSPARRGSRSRTTRPGGSSACTDCVAGSRTASS